MTSRRKQVLKALLQAKFALSAYDLAKICNSGAAKPMPPMSVYRILEFLQVEQFVHKLEIANKYVACRHIRCKHEHGRSQFLICNDCNKVKEVEVSSETLSAVETAANVAEFQVLNPHLELSGRCNSCISGAA